MSEYYYRTYTYRIYPNKTQMNKIDSTINMAREMYNILLIKKYQLYKKFLVYVERYGNKGINTYTNFNSRFKLSSIKSIKQQEKKFYQVDSLALCAELNNLNRAFENYFSGVSTGKPKYKKRKDKNSYTTSNVNNNIRIENNKIRLPKIGKIKIKLHRLLPEQCRIKRIIVWNDKSTRYYVSLVLETVQNFEKKEPEPLENIIGLDFKVGDVFVGNSGERPKYGPKYQQEYIKLSIKEKELKRKTKFSKSYFRCIDKIRRIHKKLACKRRNFLHQLSTILIKKFKNIAIETLSLKDIAQRLTTGKNIYNTSYYRFSKMLEYKIQGVLIRVNKWFPSSKLCSHCGWKKRKLKLSTRIYRCQQCGMILDRDENAAKNIMLEGMRLLGL